MYKHPNYEMLNLNDLTNNLSSAIGILENKGHFSRAQIDWAEEVKSRIICEMKGRNDTYFYNNNWTKNRNITNKTYEIKKVIFNPPATIILWKDETKTVVKTNNEEFDCEKGFAMAFCKKILGINYKPLFKKVLNNSICTKTNTEPDWAKLSKELFEEIDTY